MARPNILFIMADQFRFDALGCVNGWIQTPNLDRLAAAGTLFANTISNSLECVPARFSLATGLYPHQSGVWENRPMTLNPKFANWTQAVEAAGYRTSLFGKTHLHRHNRDLRNDLPLMHALGLQVVNETTGPPGNARVLSEMTALWEERGYWDAYKAYMEEQSGDAHYKPKPSPLPLKLYYDVYVPQQAKKYLRALKGSDPWFCWVSFGGPHPPYDTPEPYASLYSDRDFPAPLPRMKNADDARGLVKETLHSKRLSPDLTRNEVAALRADYAGAITLIDEQIGELLAAVKERGEADNTLVIFTSDHGEMNGDHGAFGKSNPLDGALRIPLIVVPPRGGRRRGGMRSDALVELMDVGATIVDYVDGKLPRKSNARSLRPVLEGGKNRIREFAVSEFEEFHVMVTDRWKVEVNKRLRPTLLIDRLNDPGELIDLSRDRSLKPVIAELAETFEVFLSETPSYDGVALARRRAA
jgi:choline-sulfatase